jgi:hypothetical protein
VRFRVHHVSICVLTCKPKVCLCQHLHALGSRVGRFRVKGSNDRTPQPLGSILTHDAGSSSQTKPQIHAVKCICEGGL